ncbi:MAG TPA: hypothetical protein VMU33_12095 [Burkholderiaceae bacterium]|nr:hypothetical protein [Burkholderiaceae bacterium]
MDNLMTALLHWAIVLTGYPTPPHVPVAQMVPHAFLVEHACGGRECKVFGWYEGKDVVYLDDRFDPANDLFAASVVVHELTHYLQAASGLDGSTQGGGPAPAGWHFVDCDLTMALEREAYAAQQAFLVRYGVYRPVGVSMHEAGCESSHAVRQADGEEPPGRAQAPSAAALPSQP